MPPEARLPVVVRGCELGVGERGRYFADLLCGNRLLLHVNVETLAVEYASPGFETRRCTFKQWLVAKRGK